MISELFAVWCELETRISAGCSAFARSYRNRDVAPLKRKSICEHFDGGKSYVCVILHERATNVCVLCVLIMYLNNVLSCCKQ